MTLKELALLIKYHGVLGNLTTLVALKELGVDLTASCPLTKQNLLHIAIMMDNSELLLFGLQYPQLLDQGHHRGVTPRTQLETIAKNSACNRAFSALPGTDKFSHPPLPCSPPLNCLSPTPPSTVDQRAPAAESNQQETTTTILEDKLQVEAIRLQNLEESRLSPTLWKTFLDDVQNHTLTLSEAGATRLVALVADNLALEDLHTNQRSQLLLSGLSLVLESSSELAAALNALGPGYVLKNFSLTEFILSPQNPAADIGLTFARSILELCPAFGTWTSFVHHNDEATTETLANRFGVVSAAKNLPSSRDLSKRIQRKLSDRLLETARLPVVDDGEEDGANSDRVLPSIREVSNESGSGSGSVSRSGSVSMSSSESLSPIGYFDETFNTVMKKLYQHQVERQKEILDQAETLALAVIREVARSLGQALEAKDNTLVLKHLKEHDQALNRLVTIQRERRGRRAQRYRRSSPLSRPWSPISRARCRAWCNPS